MSVSSVGDGKETLKCTHALPRQTKYLRELGLKTNFDGLMETVNS